MYSIRLLVSKIFILSKKISNSEHLLDGQKNDFLLVSIMGVELAIEHGLKEATWTELVAGVLLLTALK